MADIDNINRRLIEVEEKLEEFDPSELDSDLSTAKNDIEDLQSDVASLRSDLEELEERVASIENAFRRH